MQPELAALLETAGITPRGEPKPMSGGDIAAVYWLETTQGAVVAKHDRAERLHGEAEGLAALREATLDGQGSQGGLVIPQVLGIAGEWLLLEALESAPRRQAGETVLGEGLRHLHAHTFTMHGWSHDNACGATPQANGGCEDGRVFQRERRLLPLANACVERGLLNSRDYDRVAQVAETLEKWLPQAPASLLHGDLWSGNVLFTPRGPALIDPSVYRHYPEVDLAMLTLFGTPSAAFFDAYWNGPTPADWPRREALFQLYPLLNHLLLFGGAYHGGVTRTLRRLENF
ncbi:fructosamine kinase family protein [Halomonas sp. Bachu 37]|uniref:fructosamine kinase family protein n=1 Tax=Halomonas kashgarensis TaxID=3084920 RepID=UPI0032167220